MRKYLIGIIVGFLLAFPFTAFGEEVTSMIGKTVQAENMVVVNGTELAVKSVNIEGTTYSPNRAIAEALGMEITFENNKVIFEAITEEAAADTVSETVEIQGGETMEQSIQRQIDVLQLKISDENAKYITIISKNPLQPLSAEDQAQVDEIVRKMNEYNQQIEALKAELEALQATP